MVDFAERLVRLVEGPSPPLFLLHGLGGHVIPFLPLARALRSERAVYAVPARGVADEDPPQASIPEMARDYVQSIRQVQPAGPYWLAGWSLGGTIAWEMTRQLQSQGQTVALLAMLDSHPLWLIRSSDLTSFLAARLVAQSGPAFADIASLPQPQQWPAFLSRAATYQGAGANALRSLLRVCQAQVQAAGVYVPKPLPEPLVGNVVNLWARERAGWPPARPWRRLCRTIRFEKVPGTHFTMLERPHVQILADRLRRLWVAS